MGLLHDILAALLEEGSDLGPILLKVRLLAARLGSQLSANGLNTNPRVTQKNLRCQITEKWNQREMRQSIAEIDELRLVQTMAVLILLLQGSIYKDYACNDVTGTVSCAALRRLDTPFVVGCSN